MENTNKSISNKEYQKAYYEKNKDKLMANLLKKVTCERCNKLISKVNLGAHQRTKLCAAMHEKVLLEDEKKREEKLWMTEINELKKLINRGYK